MIGALSLTTVVGMGAFAVEAAQGYSAKVNNQRIADMASLAGALAYNVGSNTGQMIATARAVVVAQGLASSAADIQLVTEGSQQLVQVTVTTSVPLSLGRVFTSALSYEVSAVGAATTTATVTAAPPCISTLDSNATTGVMLSGGVSIGAPGCDIETNGRVEVPWGTTITAKRVDAGGVVVNPGSGITTAPTAGNIHAGQPAPATDWMSGDTALKNVLCQVNKITGGSDADYPDNNNVLCTNPQVLPATLTAPGTEDWDLDYSPSGPVLPAWFNSSTNTYTIPAGARNIRDLNISGGITAIFQGPVTLSIRSLNMGGSGMTIGDGDVTVAQTFGFNSGSVITIGAGNHSFGTLAVTGGRTLHIGAGNLLVGGAITMDGGSYIFANVGVGNTVTIGNNGTGSPATAISIGGGSKLCFAGGSGTTCSTPTAAAGTFNANGSVISSGGSTIVFPKAATHVIDGHLSLNGSSIFGSGSYVIGGNFTNNTGGTMSGTEVTFALSGTFTLSGGTSLDLAAPTSSSSYGVPGVLVATKSMAATSIGGGSANRYAGLLYAPKSNMLISGGGSISTNGGACLMMILNRLTLSGGGALSNGTCAGLTGGTNSVASVKLHK